MEGSENGFYCYPHGGAAEIPFSFPQSAAASSGVRAPTVAAEPLRRKRGRPRKYGPQNSTVSASLSFSPHGLSSLRFSQGVLKGGRPQGESLGRTGQKFTPHFFTVAAGEDVANRIMSFIQEQNRAVCVISASGMIGDVTLRQPATAGGHKTYKGNFQILSLSGSFILPKSGASARTGALSICLSEEGFIVGGGIGGPLVAATPVQVVAGSFLVDSSDDMDAKSNSSISTAFRVVSEESTSMAFNPDDHHPPRHHHPWVDWGEREEFHGDS